VICRVERLADNIPIMTIGSIVDALSFLIFDDLFFIINDVLVDRFDEPTQLVRFGPRVQPAVTKVFGIEEQEMFE